MISRAQASLVVDTLISLLAVTKSRCYISVRVIDSVIKNPTTAKIEDSSTSAEMPTIIIHANIDDTTLSIEIDDTTLVSEILQTGMEVPA